MGLKKFDRHGRKRTTPVVGKDGNLHGAVLLGQEPEDRPKELSREMVLYLGAVELNKVMASAEREARELYGFLDPATTDPVMFKGLETYHGLLVEQIAGLRPMLLAAVVGASKPNLVRYHRLIGDLAKDLGMPWEPLPEEATKDIVVKLGEGS